MALVFAPFTPQQVTALDRWQNGGMAVHPFTCGNDHPEPRSLIPTRDGWVCSVCDYTQNWAHDFMATTATPTSVASPILVQIVDKAVQLLPCPFCGSADVSSDSAEEGRYDVTCFNCHAGTIAVGPSTNERASAIKAWNTRSPLHPARTLLNDY